MNHTSPYTDLNPFSRKSPTPKAATWPVLKPRPTVPPTNVHGAALAAPVTLLIRTKHMPLLKELAGPRAFSSF